MHFNKIQQWLQAPDDRPAYLILLHFLMLLLAYLIAHVIGIFSAWPEEGLLTQWDPGWYYSIRTFGYSYNPDAQNNTGFFPFFPYVWRMLHLNNAGISALNFVIFLLGVWVFASTFKPSRLQLLLLLVLPGSVYMVLPYSESFFFMAGMLALKGLSSNRPGFSWTGIFIMSMIRVSGLFILPGLGLYVLLQIISGKMPFLKGITTILLYASAIFLGTGLVVLLQWYETGVWFAYFKSQTEHWHHHFHLPLWKYTTWDGLRMLWLDGAAMMVSAIALGLLVYSLVKYVASRTLDIALLQKPEWMASVAYLFCFACYIIFHHPEGGEGETTLAGMNRYVFAGPFTFVFVLYIWRYFHEHRHLFLLVTAACFLVTLPLGIFRPLNGLLTHQRILYFFNMYLTFVFGLVLVPGRYALWAGLVLYVGGIVAILRLYDMYLTGWWIG